LTKFVVVPLKKLISRLPPERITKILSSFSCKRDVDVENFLKELAVVYEKRHLARTNIIFSDGSYDEPVAYFSIAVSSMDASRIECSNALRKKMNIYDDIAQSFLIGQIGKRDNAPKGLGEFAISCATDLILEANDRVGCRVVRLDCRKALIKYYEKNGFISVGHNEEKDLYEMIKILV